MGFAVVVGSLVDEEEVFKVDVVKVDEDLLVEDELVLVVLEVEEDLVDDVVFEEDEVLEDEVVVVGF